MPVMGALLLVWLVVWAVPTSRGLRTVCKPIPSTLSLCHGLEYTDMRLPNLLGHDSLREVQQQSASWAPLLAKRCHPDSRRFLCSLFAPVCLSELPEAVWPCRPLCEAVRAGCLPVMSAFGFPWPDMFNCSLFPSGTELCVPPTGAGAGRSPVAQEGSQVMCGACSQTYDGEELRAAYCRSGFVVSLKLGDTSAVGPDLKLVLKGRSRVVLRNPNPAEEEAAVRSALWLPEAGTCICTQLDSPDILLIGLGNIDGSRLVLSRLHKWPKSERDLKKVIRSLQKIRC